MPILSISLRGTELEDKTLCLLERPYAFSSLKLLHIYHNIDSVHFADSVEKKNQTQLFIRLGGLVENSSQLINYVGDFKTAVRHTIIQKYDKDDFQSGQGTLSTTLTGDDYAVNARNTDRYTSQLDINHLIPIGGTRHNTGELISRDSFKSLHDTGVLPFTGELEFELHYMDKNGDINPITSTTGGVVVNSSKGQPVTFLTLMFEYKE